MSGNIVDVLLVVDADQIIDGVGGTQQSRVPGAVYLVAQRKLVDGSASGDQQDGGNELWIDVKKGDVIRWRATTVSRNFDRSTVISRVYKGNKQTANAGDISDPELHWFEDVLVPYVKKGSNVSNPPNIGTTSTTVSLWQADAEKPGADKIWYMIDFYVLDSQGNIISERLNWDPFITVNP